MKISEVSKKYDISPDTLRYYEKEGLLPNVKKNASGIREYSEADCGWVEFIKCMRGAGLSIEVLARYIELFYKGDSTKEERKNILIEERAKLIEKRDTIQATIERLDYKIKVYDKTMVQKEKELLQK
ncbi:MAG: MerR family transcriptional regulator [Candidatus Gastranaerophilales bacterium]|nr:MerR family transcriptional regulator [Candidatus Gastranaerophilales bacterium]